MTKLTKADEQAGIKIHLHGRNAWRLQLKPGAVRQLQRLLTADSFWAQGRKCSELRAMLHGSQASVSAWDRGKLIAFGRATSDGVYRAVLWDVVVRQSHQGKGLGRCIVERLLSAPSLKHVERTYIMTTNSREFYTQIGFKIERKQLLMGIKQEKVKTL